MRLWGLVVDFWKFVCGKPAAPAAATDEPPTEASGEAASYELLYHEAIGALGHQRDSLDALHTRAGVLLSAVVLVGSVLGPSTPGKQAWPLGLIAMALLVLAGLVLIALLLPRDWRWGVDVMLILREYIESPRPADLKTIWRSRAWYINDDLEANRVQLERMQKFFAAAAVLAGGAVIGWLIEIAVG